MSHPPLIVHVIFHLGVGGLENGLVNLINHIPADRYRHAIICLKGFSEFHKRLNRDDVEIIALNNAKEKISVSTANFTECSGNLSRISCTRVISQLWKRRWLLLWQV